ncbi:MAG: hypothetical protein RSF00_05495 [Oscillospiraceae bacterium]
MEISCGAGISIETKGTGACLGFAKEELKAYLLAMFKTLDFEKKRGAVKILLEVRNSPVLNFDGYQLLITEQEVRITSRMERGVLHGVYHLLRLLGCSFWFSKTSIQNAPTLRRTTLNSGLFTENPMLESRGICLYGVTGKTVADVLATVDFMAKNNYNLLVTAVHIKGDAPENAHAIFWDEVQATVLPHLKKRGIELCVSPFCDTADSAKTNDGKQIDEVENHDILKTAFGDDALLLSDTKEAFSVDNADKSAHSLYLIDTDMGDSYSWQTNLWIQPKSAKELVACAANAGLKGIVSLWRPISVWWSASLNFSFLREAYYHPDFSQRLMLEKLCADLWSVCTPTFASVMELLYENVQDKALWSRAPRAPKGLQEHTLLRNSALDGYNQNALKEKADEITALLNSVLITRLSEHERYHMDCLKAYIKQQKQFYLSIDQLCSDASSAAKMPAYYKCLAGIRGSIGEGFASEKYARWCLSEAVASPPDTNTP